MKTISGDIQIHIIILQLHTTNEDHMIYKMKKKKKKIEKKILKAKNFAIYYLSCFLIP